MDKKSNEKGVCWDKQHNKWVVTVYAKGVCNFIGRFNKEKDAIDARISAEVKHGVVGRRRTSYIKDNKGYICLTQNQWAIVDECDFENVNKSLWSARFDSDTQSYYALCSKVIEKKKTILMHRFITNPSITKVIDHINHNTLDNRRSNLREVTQSRNAANSRMRSSNKSGTIGVHWNKRQSQWIATIKTDLKAIYLGCFLKKEDAIKVREEAEAKYHGANSYKNSIGQCKKIIVVEDK